MDVDDLIMCSNLLQTALADALRRLGGSFVVSMAEDEDDDRPKDIRFASYHDGSATIMLVTDGVRVEDGAVREVTLRLLGGGANEHTAPIEAPAPPTEGQVWETLSGELHRIFAVTNDHVMWRAPDGAQYTRPIGVWRAWVQRTGARCVRGDAA